MVHKGSCHCGRVAFEVEGEIDSGMACNCSMCGRRGSLLSELDRYWNYLASMRKVAQAGGEVLGEPMMIPGIGDYVAFQDTEGNRVSMLQPLPRK